MDAIQPIEGLEYEGQPDVSMGADEPIPSNWTDDEIQELKRDLQRDLDAARASKTQIDERVKRYRRYFALDKEPPAYKGQPNHVVPYIRAKIAGATAHFRGALNQDPFYVVRPYTAEAEKNRPVWETMMERELDRSSSQRQVFLGVEEACLTGTGMMQLSVTQPFDEYLIQMKAIRLEDFFAAPAGVEDISRISTFYRFVEPWHVIRQRMEAGEYDEEATENVKSHLTTRTTYDEEMDGSRVQSYQNENQLVELYECYYRWGNESKGYSLWRVIYSHANSSVLRLEESPYLDCFDAPPYCPIRPMPRIGYFYGESYAQVLEGIQNIMDFAYNSKIAYDQFAVSPPIFVNENSPIWAMLGEGGIAPGMKIPTPGNPQEDVYVPQLPQATEAMSLLETARALGEDATFSDLQLQGVPTQKVKSATEINAMTNAANKKLSEDLANISYDLSILGKMYWSLIYKYKIEPAGIMPVFQGSDQYLIAAHEVSQEEIAESMVEYIQRASGVMFGPEDSQQIAQMAMASLGDDTIFISSAKRDDMEWKPNGHQLVPDKQLRAQKMQALLQTMMPALSMAMQFKPFWHAMKDWLISMDIHNWTDYLPAQTPQQIPTQEDMANFSNIMQQLRVGGEQ